MKVLRRYCAAVALLLVSTALLAGRRKQAAAPLGSGDWLAVPGKRVGGIALGDAEAKVFKLFPKRSIASSQEAGSLGPVCGTSYTVGLLQDAKRPGFLHVFAKDGNVIEIEVGGARYHTAAGIESNSPPEGVRLHYKGMKSFLFRHCCDESLNEGPLVLWTDRSRGIAFSFTYPAKGDRTFRVSTLIVFNPGAPFCEQGSVFPDAQRWRELPPYSLALPQTTAGLVFGDAPQGFDQ